MNKLLVLMLVASATLLAAAPSAQARQFCTYGTGDPCDSYVVCVWDRLAGDWACYGYVDPCWFRCWGPVEPRMIDLCSMMDNCVILPP